MKILIPVSLLTVVLLFTACKKSSTTPTTPPSTGTLLSKFILFDTTQTAPSDTMEILTFKHDNLNRLISISDLNYDGGVADPTGAVTESLFYNGSDTIPYKTINSEPSYSSNGTSLEYYDDTDFYSLNSGIVRDSDISVIIDGGTVQTYDKFTNINYSSGTTVYETNIGYIPSFYIDYMDTVSQNIINGKVVSQTNISVNGNDENAPDCTFSFDNHPNPFFTSYTNLPHIFVIDAYLDGQQRNNYTEITENPKGTSGLYHVKYQYTYQSNGYPSSVIETDYSSGSPVFNFKAIYIYQ